MRIENEQIHYRTRFELCPYETTDQALTPALKCIFIWICHKKLDKRSELFFPARNEREPSGFLLELISVS